MIFRNAGGVSILAAVFAAGSFVATAAWQPPTTCEVKETGSPCMSMPCGKVRCCKSLAGWLALSPEKAERVAEIAAPFDRQKAELEAALFTERQALADLFEGAEGTAEGTDKEILEQVERVIDASSKLERHVAAYLIALRPVLTDEQRTRLYKSCAKGVRQACGLRWRHRVQAGGGCGPSGVPTGG